MKYRKKPVVIEAEQFWPDVKPWPIGVVEHWDSMSYGDYTIQTLEGRYNVSPGDWIITGVKGEKYPCNPDIFEATYEAVGGK